MAKKKDGWPGKLRKGRFSEYCKREGFEGPSVACAKKAMKSDDASTRGMATFYMNTVKPGGKTAAALKDSAFLEADDTEEDLKVYPEVDETPEEEEKKEDETGDSEEKPEEKKEEPEETPAEKPEETPEQSAEEKTETVKESKSLSPISIQILEQGDNDDEYFELMKLDAVRSPVHVASAVRKAVKEALTKLGKEFDSIEIAFRRSTGVQEKETPKLNLDEYVGSEVIVEVENGAKAYKGKLEKEEDTFSVVSKKSKQAVSPEAVTRLLVKKAE